MTQRQKSHFSGNEKDQLFFKISWTWMLDDVVNNVIINIFQSFYVILNTDIIMYTLVYS